MQKHRFMRKIFSKLGIKVPKLEKEYLHKIFTANVERLNECFPSKTVKEGKDVCTQHAYST